MGLVPECIMAPAMVLYRSTQFRPATVETVPDMSKILYNADEGMDEGMGEGPRFQTQCRSAHVENELFDNSHWVMR